MKLCGTLDAVTVELEGTTLIEASAGTGKTHTIATLFVRLLLEKGYGVAEILVVTYTRAATAELRQRIRARVSDALDVLTRLDEGALPDAQLSQVDPALLAIARHSVQRGTAKRDRKRLLDAVRSFDLAAISTIHGFCQRVLKQAAFESGTDFDLELIENERPLLEEVVYDYWVRALHDASWGLVQTVAAAFTPDELVRVTAGALANPDLVLIPQAQHVVTDALEARFARQTAELERLMAAHAEEVRTLLTTKGSLNGSSYRSETIEGRWLPALARASSFTPGKLPDWLSKLCPGQFKVRKGQTEPKHVVFEACGELLAIEEELAPRLHGNLIAFQLECVRYARTELLTRKLGRRVQSFDDLLLRLRSATLGREGDKLLARIRTLHPAALIDEFQDTDPVQCAVFQRIYDPAAPAPGVLFFIGDPKQAIYAFRGADVFAYMAAAARASQGAYTLGVNRRSDPKLVHAVNLVWSRASAPFLFEDIRFAPVDAAPGREDAIPHGAALELCWVEQDEHARGGDALRKRIAAQVAADIVDLLQRGECIADTALQPRHVAVLCRTNAEAGHVQEALRARGVPSVLDGDRSVLDSTMADELERVLSALCEPGDAALVRGALITSIFGQDAAALRQLEHDEHAWDQWASQFHAWHEVWEARGFVQALHALMDEQQVSARLLALRDGERRMTDLLHLSELLHAEAMRSGEGPFALLAWYRRMRHDADERQGLAPEAAQIRLESDAHAVTLTTIHKSKGLEYPIVYLPYLWNGSLLFASEAKRPRFHDGDNADRLTLDLGGKETPGHAAHVVQAQREALAENLRLLYVALTRAKHKLCIAWGALADISTSALGYLLHRASVDARRDAGAATTIHKLTPEEVRADLSALADASGGAIAVRTFPQHDPGLYQAHADAPRTLLARNLSRTLSDAVRTSSFSRLVAGQDHTRIDSADDALDRDGIEAVVSAASVASPAQQRIALADFPAGVTPGHLIHEIYETIDFRSDQAQLVAHAEAKLRAYGMEVAHAPVLGGALFDALVTPLHEQADPLGLPRLAQVGLQDRLTELEFVFPVASAGSSSGERPLLTAAKLGRVLSLHARSDAERAYAARVSRLGFAPLAGYLRGFMDLVVRHHDRYYLIDYKSNHLGEHAADYAPGLLWETMASHHYVLQYLFYCVALQRHLRARLRDYAYDAHFGGVYYLFVRGMSRAHPLRTGVYWDRPAPELLASLDALLERGGAS